MLENDRVEISEGIEIIKIIASKECDICHYWYLLTKHFSYEPYGCHDLIQKSMNFNDVAIVSIKWNDYKIHFCYISKDDSINIMNRDIVLNRAKDFDKNDQER